MIKTIYTCDICKKEVSHGELWMFGAFYKHQLYSSDNKTATRHACRDCLKKMGVLPVSAEEKKIMPQPPTVEELFRQIIEMVGGFDKAND